MCTSGHHESFVDWNDMHPILSGIAASEKVSAPASSAESQSKPIIQLPEIDEAKITIVIENTFDMLLPSTDLAKRFRLGSNPFERSLPTAEHGFSALIQVRNGQKSGSILFDTGVSTRGFLYNVDVLELQLTDLQAVILSHGHPDHALGLQGLSERVGKRNLPLILHPDAFLERKLVLPNGDEVHLPPPRKTDFRAENIEFVQETKPSALVDNMILVSGEVARTTSFEKGFPIHYAKRDGQWAHDPLIMDDQCAIMNLRNKGLVIITGCGHSGIINIVRNAQALTGVQNVHAIIGGFHLSGGLFEKIIPQTVEELKNISPRHVIPGHCTGWVATHQIARVMPDAFIQSAVGTTLEL
jgi:7,8-dihydropterin-6-yl-methyl-4-(beta-D-ribofuranosyl)aminobenzene 5'-phosphate synthase